jgi:predicted nucleic acid-binding Zn ribbon protein
VKSLKELMGASLAQVAKSTSSAVPLQSLWKQAVGEIVANNSTPSKFEFGTLYVNCTNMAWKDSLNAQNDQLKQKVNATAGSQFVNTLIFEVRQ